QASMIEYWDDKIHLEEFAELYVDEDNIRNNPEDYYVEKTLTDDGKKHLEYLKSIVGTDEEEEDTQEKIDSIEDDQEDVDGIECWEYSEESIMNTVESEKEHILEYSYNNIDILVDYGYVNKVKNDNYWGRGTSYYYEGAGIKLGGKSIEDIIFDKDEYINGLREQYG